MEVGPASPRHAEAQADDRAVAIVVQEEHSARLVDVKALLTAAVLALPTYPNDEACRSACPRGPPAPSRDHRAWRGGHDVSPMCATLITHVTPSRFAAMHTSRIADRVIVFVDEVQPKGVPQGAAWAAMVCFLCSGPSRVEQWRESAPVVLLCCAGAPLGPSLRHHHALRCAAYFVARSMGPGAACSARDEAMACVWFASFDGDTAFRGLTSSAAQPLPSAQPHWRLFRAYQGLLAGDVVWRVLQCTGEQADQAARHAVARCRLEHVHTVWRDLCRRVDALVRDPACCADVLRQPLPQDPADAAHASAALLAGHWGDRSLGQVAQLLALSCHLSEHYAVALAALRADCGLSCAQDGVLRCVNVQQQPQQQQLQQLEPQQTEWQFVPIPYEARFAAALREQAGVTLSNRVSRHEEVHLTHTVLASTMRVIAYCALNMHKAATFAPWEVKTFDNKSDGRMRFQLFPQGAFERVVELRCVKENDDREAWPETAPAWMHALRDPVPRWRSCDRCRFLAGVMTLRQRKRVHVFYTDSHYGFDLLGQQRLSQHYSPPPPQHPAVYLGRVRVKGGRVSLCLDDVDFLPFVTFTTQ